MNGPSEPTTLRDQIIGLGARSIRKSYYPQLQRQIDDLKTAKKALEERSEQLLQTVNDLEASRQQAEEDAQNFRLLFEGITDGVAVADPATLRFQRVNPAFCQMLGYSEDELLRLSIRDIHPEEEMRELINDIKSQKPNTAVALKNLPFKRKDQTIFYADMHSSGVEIRGRIYVLGVCRDITEHKQTEEKIRALNASLEDRVRERAQQLAESEARYRTLYESSPVSIWQEDWTQVIESINELRAQRISDFPAYFREHPQFVARALHDVKILDVNHWTLRMFAAKNKSELLASLQVVFGTDATLPGFIGELCALAQGQEFYRTEMALNTLAGDVIDTLLSMTFPPPGSHSGEVLVSVMDITEQRKIEQALKTGEERLRFFFERQLVGMAITSPEKGWLQVNDKLCQMLGYYREELANKTWVEMTHPDDLPADIAQFERMSRGEIESYTLEKRFLRKDGSIVFTELAVGCVRKADGSLDYVLAMVEDITERKRAEEALRTLNATLEERIEQRTAELNSAITMLQTEAAVRKQAEEATRVSEQWFRAIFEQSPTGIAIINSWTGAFLEVNPKLCEISGRSKEEMLTLDFMRITHPDDLQEDLDNMDRLRKGEIRSFVMEKRYIRPDGLWVWASLTVVPMWTELEKSKWHIAMVEDITERKRAENELHRINRLYAVLIQVNQAVIRADSHERLLQQICEICIQFGGFKMAWVGRVNTETQQVVPIASAGDERDYLHKISIYADERPEGKGATGTSIREGRTCVCNDFLHHPDTLPWREAAAESGFQAAISLPLRNEGRIYGALAVYTDNPNYFHSREVQLLEEVASDISFALDHLDQEIRRKQNEEALKQAKASAEAANQAKDQFLAMLSHELRTPLTPVVATLSSLSTQEEISGELQADMEMILRNVQMEVKLIDDLLDVTRISRGAIDLHPEAVDACLLLQSALDICQKDIETKRLDISLSFQAKMRHITVDPARMRQVFWNLIKNAVAYTPEGGRITLRTFNIDDRLKIEIEDTGIGIRPEVLPKLFKPFERGNHAAFPRRFGGLGLGLSIAKSVVDLHHGTLTAFSQGEGKGATFTVDLPALATPAEPHRKMASPPGVRESAKKILLVEDHPDTLLAMSKLLRKWGYAISTADCVRTALECLASESFDVLISDLGLPDGSGLEIMRALKDHPNIKGIALSGYGTDEDIRKSLEAGFQEHLVKPVTAENLRHAVQRTASLRG